MKHSSFPYALAIVCAFVLGICVFANVRAIDFETWKTLSSQQQAEITATARAMTLYLANSAVVDTDEEHGNSYNWGRKGEVTINGELQRFEDGSVSVDRCVMGTNPDNTEKELVEHWYEPNPSWGGEVRKLQMQCSSFQFGTTCQAGACVPVIPPPDDKVEVTTAECVDWLFGCICADGYEPDYDEASDKAFCSRRVETKYAYDDLKGAWEPVVVSINWRGTDYKHNPVWSYFSEGKETFERAAAAFRAGPDPKNKEERDEYREESMCVRNLADQYATVFNACFKKVGPARAFDEYTECVEQNGGDRYRDQAQECGASLMSGSYDVIDTPYGTDEPETPQDAQADLIDRFKKALIASRPSPDDFPPLDNGIDPESDLEWKVGIPYGPFTFNSRSVLDFQYVFTLTQDGSKATITLPDATTLDPSYVWAGARTTLPVGTTIVTPPDGRLEFRFSMDISYREGTPEFELHGSNTRRAGNMVQVVMGENSEAHVEEVYPGFAVLKVKRGHVRFYTNSTKTPLGAASETGVAPITKGTDFTLAYDPETGTTIFELYDGAIDVVRDEDYLAENPNVLASLVTSYGSDIQRAEVATDGSVVENIGIPQSEWEEFTASQSPRSASESGGLSWVLLVALLGAAGGGYAAYRKGIFKKIVPPQG